MKTREQIFAKSEQVRPHDTLNVDYAVQWDTNEPNQWSGWYTVSMLVLEEE